PPQVDLDDLVEAGQVDVDGGAVIGVGGRVVDQDVEAAEPLDGGGHAGVGLLGVAGVGRVDGGCSVDGGGRLFQGVDLAGRQHHRRALFGVDPGDGRADTFGR